MKLLFINMILVFSNTLLFAQSNDDTLYLHAHGALLQQKYQKADSCLRLITNKNEEYIHLKADMHYGLKNYSACIQLISAQATVDNRLLYLKAQAYARIGITDSCIATLQTYLQTSPKKTEPQIKLDSAFAPISGSPQWVNLWKTNWYTRQERTLAELQYLFSQKDYLALSDTIASIAPDKRTGMHYYYLSITHAALLKNKEALDDIENALAQDRLNTQFLLQQAQLLKTLGKYKASVNVYRHIYRSTPEVFEIYPEYSDALLLNQQFTDAIDVLKTYLKYLPGNLDVRIQLASTQIKAGEYLNALALLNKLIKQYPHLAKLYKLRGLCYYNTNMTAYAERDFLFLRDLLPGDNEVYYYLARIKLSTGEQQAACKFFERSAALGNREAYIKYLENCE